MKKSTILILFSISMFLLAVVSGCGPKVLIHPSPEKAGEYEFSQAEQLYEKGEHKKALEQYILYVNRYPGTSITPVALMKIGSLYSQMEKYEDAINSYQRLVNEFPDSFLVPDARVEILAILLKEEKFLQLLDYSEKISHKTLSRVQGLRMYLMKGEAFFATGGTIKAGLEFFRAYNLGTAPEKEAIYEKIKDVFVGLSESDIDILVNSLEQPDDVNMALALKELTSFNQDVIGCLLPLSGPYKEIGLRALRGIELAFSAWGRNDNRLRIVVKDTAADQEDTIKAMNELLTEKPACIIGPLITADIAARIAQTNRIPMITLSQKESVPQIGEYIFRNFITPEMQVKALVAHASQVRGAKKFAILYPDERYGKTHMHLFWDEVLKTGGEVVGVEGYDPDLTDFADPVKKLVGLYYKVPSDLKITIVEPFNAQKAVEMSRAYLFETRFTAEPVYFQWTDCARQILAEKKDAETDSSDLNPIVEFDAVFIPDSPRKTALIVPQFPYYDVNNIILLGTNIWHSSELIRTARQYVQGAVISEGFFKESRSLKVSRFREDFKEAYDEDPEFIEAISYDTAMLVMQTLSTGNYQLRSEIKDAFFNLEPFEGVTGSTTFDEIGEAVKDLFMLSVRGGRFVEINR
jgi:branched-chain amino acid transport system substrate-binding protein